jgi:hypothetical protein
LDVKVGTNLFLKALLDDLTWAIGNRAPDQCNNSGSST